MPKNIQLSLRLLISDLEEKGVIQPSWKNFSKLGKDKFHCHLSYNWVVCWRWEEENNIIEVYYAGSRENAPY